MIKKENFVPMAFFKKEVYTGSQKGMRYRVEKSEEEFHACVYPEPYSYDATPEEKKTRTTAPFTEEGRESIINWLNDQYQTRKPEWDKAARR